MANYNLVQVVFDRSNLSPNEDVAVMAFHIRATVQAAPDIIPITDEIRQDFAGRLNIWWNNVQDLVTSKIQLHEYRFYDVPSAPGGDMGDPVLVLGSASPGTATSQVLPPQNSISVTLRTDSRKTWGRNYMPGMVASSLDPNGRLLQPVATELAAAWHGLTSRASTGGALVVFSRKQWTHHDPQTIQVDDITDVVRRRRFSEPHFRETLSAG